MEKSEVAIVIIVYNTVDLIRKQIECIRLFCKDQHDIIIIDNSTIPEISAAVCYHSKELKCKYEKTNSPSTDNSTSHAFALNISFSNLKNRYNYFLFLDHDNFPIKEFSIKEILAGKIMAGLGQIKPSGKEYFWPGCFMLDRVKTDRNITDFNFSTNPKLGLDTGGDLYKMIEKYGKQNCIFFNEKHHENKEFNKSFYNFYATINDEMFMHFINSSNWANAAGNTERVNSLLNILEQRIKNN